MMRIYLVLGVVIRWVGRYSWRGAGAPRTGPSAKVLDARLVCDRTIGMLPMQRGDRSMAPSGPSPLPLLSGLRTTWHRAAV